MCAICDSSRVHRSEQADLLSSQDVETAETVHRPYPALLNSGRQDLVPELPSESPLPSLLARTDCAQIIEKDPLQPSGPPQASLVEIGPRFVLTPIRIFEGSFGGPTLFANQEFVTPAAMRASIKRQAGDKYRGRKEGEQDRDMRGEKRRRDLPDDLLSRKRVFA